MRPEWLRRLTQKGRQTEVTVASAPAFSTERQLSESDIKLSKDWLDVLGNENNTLVELRQEVEGLLSQQKFVEALTRVNTFFRISIDGLQTSGTDKESIARIGLVGNLLTSLVTNSLTQLFETRDTNTILGRGENQRTSYDKIDPSREFNEVDKSVLAGILSLREFALDGGERLPSYRYFLSPDVQFIASTYTGDDSAQRFNRDISQTLFPTMLLLNLIKNEATVAVDDARMSVLDDYSSRQTEAQKLIQFRRDNSIDSPLALQRKIFMKATYP